MKLGDVLKKERGRKKMTAEDVAAYLSIPPEQYAEMEGGESPIEELGPKLAQVAIVLKVATSRLLSEDGRFASTARQPGQCGQLIRRHREARQLTQEEFAKQLDVPLAEVVSLEDGNSPIETYGPLLLGFAEAVEQPIFNLFYPCGLPFQELTDYP